MRTLPRIIRVAEDPTAARRERPLAAAVLLGLLAAAGCSEEPPRASGPPIISAESRERAIEAIRVHLEEHRVAEAAAIGDRLLAAAREDPSVNDLLGRVALIESEALAGEARTDRRRVALSRLQAAIAGGVESAETLALAAGLAESLGDPGFAEPLRRALAAAPAAGAEAELSLAWNLALQERLDEALEVALAARERSPDLAMGAAMVGELRLSRGDRMGLADLAEARRLDGGSLPLRVREASWHRRLGDPEHSALLLSSLDESLRSDPEAARELAAAHAARGDMEGAAAAWEAALAAHPRRLDAAIALAEAWLAAGEHRRSLAAIRHAESIDPLNREIARLRRTISGGSEPAVPPRSH